MSDRMELLETLNAARCLLAELSAYLTGNTPAPLEQRVAALRRHIDKLIDESRPLPRPRLVADHVRFGDTPIHVGPPPGMKPIKE